MIKMNTQKEKAQRSPTGKGRWCCNSQQNNQKVQLSYIAIGDNNIPKKTAKRYEYFLPAARNNLDGKKSTFTILIHHI